MLLSGLKKKTVELPIDAQAFAKIMDKLIAKSRYVKKTVAPSETVDFSKSFQK